MINKSILTGIMKFNCIGMIFTIAAMLVSGCNQSEGRVYVSLVKLIVSPEKYVAKEIMVKGYLDTDFSEPYLFLTKEDALMGNFGSAIRIHDRNGDLKKQGCSGYVTMVGDFQQLEYLPFPVMATVISVSKYDFSDEEGIKQEDCWLLR